MHVHADRIRKPAHGREGISLLYHRCRNTHDNLIAELDIDCFIAVKIHFYQHRNFSFVMSAGMHRAPFSRCLVFITLRKSVIGMIAQRASYDKRSSPFPEKE